MPTLRDAATRHENMVNKDRTKGIGPIPLVTVVVVVMGLLNVPQRP